MDVSFIEAGPTVYIAGVSTPNKAVFEQYLHDIGETMPDREDDFFPSILVEQAGRVCYQSFSNSASRPHEAYLNDSIIAHGHLSTFEHVSVTFIVANLARDIEMELIRHRAGTAYSWESTRFTDKRMRFAVPVRLRGVGMEQARERFRQSCLMCVEEYKSLKEEARQNTDEGTLKRKRATEAARSVLPGSRASDGWVTLNARAIRHIVKMRTDIHADLSIREFGWKIFEAANSVIPALLQDAVITEAEHVPQVSFPN